MNISNLKRILSLLLVCILLCCCVLRPVSASATSVGVATAGAVVGINPLIGVSAILVCLGIGYVASGAFEDLVSNIAEKIPSEFIIESSAGVQYIEAVTYDDICYVPQALVEWINGLIWSGDEEIEPVVNTTFTFDSTQQTAVYERCVQWLNSTYPGEFEYCCQYRNCYVTLGYDSDNTAYRLCAFADSNVQFYVDDSGYLCVQCSTPYKYIFVSDPKSKYVTSDGGITAKVWPVATVQSAKSGDRTYSVPVGLTISSSASKNLTDDDLQTWIQTGIWIIEIPDEETGGDDGNNNDDDTKKTPYVPVRVGEDVPDTGSQTQEEAQSGKESSGETYQTGNKVEIDVDSESDYELSEPEWPELVIDPFPEFDDPNNPSDVPDGGTLWEWMLNGIKELIQWLGSYIITFFQWFWDQLLTVLEWLGDIIKLLPQQLYYDLLQIAQWLVDAFKPLFQQLAEWLKPLMDYLLEGLKTIFVPSEDYLTIKVQSLRSKFDWIDPFFAFADNISSELLSSEPPVIYIHLDAAEGSYNYGGTIPFLDMTWYSRYKAQGDAILSGFLWALFAWRMYLKLPGIINGASGTLGHMSSGYSRKDDD